MMIGGLRVGMCKRRNGTRSRRTIANTDGATFVGGGENLGKGNWGPVLRAWKIGLSMVSIFKFLLLMME